MKEEKIALITGASRGIGRATALEFAKRGYYVIIHYKSNEQSAKSVKQEIINQCHQDCMVYQADLEKEMEVKRMISYLYQRLGHIDVLVNNAAIALDTLFEDKTTENFRKTLEVNLVAPFLLAKEMGQRMYQQQSGKIINVSSTNGIDTFYPMSTDYDASKAGLISLTHNLAKQFAPYVNVNAVAPGWVKTDMNRELDHEFTFEELKKIFLGRFAEPEEIAKVIAFLASDDASYIDGEIIRVDGGY